MFLEFDRGRLADTSRKTLAAVLNTPAPDAPIVYVTDRWLRLLKEHKRRAAKVIKILQALMKMKETTSRVPIRVSQAPWRRRPGYFRF